MKYEMNNVFKENRRQFEKYMYCNIHIYYNITVNKANFFKN